MAEAAFYLPGKSSQGKLHPPGFNANNSNSQTKKVAYFLPFLQSENPSRAILTPPLLIQHHGGCRLTP